MKFHVYYNLCFSLVCFLFTFLTGCLAQNRPTSSSPTSAVPLPVTEIPSTQTPVEATTQGPVFRGLKVEAPNCDYGGEFKSIEAVDELTVRIALCMPDASFPAKIAFPSFAIQPAEYLETTHGSPLEMPIGTGPYRVEAWEHGSQLVLTRFEDYWGEPAMNQRVVFRWNSASAQRMRELQKGTVDGIDSLEPADFETAQRDTNLQLLIRPALDILYIGFNKDPQVDGFDNANNPLAKEKVRRAIAMGIDRQRIVARFYPPGSEVADYFTPCAIPNGCVGEKWYDFDPDAARALLAEAGYPDGFETVLNYREVARSYLPDPNVVAEEIHDQLKNNLNITVTIEKMDTEAFLDAVDLGQLTGLHLLGWGAYYPDQTDFLDHHFGESASRQFGATFEDITSALTMSARLSFNEERRPYYEAANNAIKQHVPMIPVVHSGSVVVFKSDVEGAYASPLGNENFAVMGIPGQDTFIWMQRAEPDSLYCADEINSESLRACAQITQPLLSYQVAETTVEPALAESYQPNDDLTEWTFHLRPGVKFHDGSFLDANDVVKSLAIQWDAADPLHTGNTGTFFFWRQLFGPFLNAPR